MSTIVLPALSTDGWVSNTPAIADYLISHFFVSEYSQTALYPTNVASFPWIIQNNQGDMLNTTRQMRTTLERYFGRYFTDTVVDIAYKEVPEFSGRIQLDLFMKFKDSDGKEFVLSRVVEIVDSKISKVLKINNATGV